METIRIFFLIIVLILIIFMIFSNEFIVVGTINEKTFSFKKELALKGYKEEKEFWRFIIKAIFLKRVMFFTENNFFLTSILSLIFNVENKKEIRGDNVAWIKNMSPKETKEVWSYFPGAFSNECNPYNEVRIKNRMILKLKDLPEKCFLEEKK